MNIKILNGKTTRIGSVFLWWFYEIHNIIKMKNLAWYCLIICCPIFSFSQNITTLQGQKKSPEIINKRISQIMDSAGIAGLSLIIINKNKVVFQKAFGYKDKAKQLPLSLSTEMYAASFTKPVTAYLFLKLVHEGKLKLDEPVYKYLKNPISSYPKWKELVNEKNFNKITARMLLSHSSGLPIFRALYNNKLSLIAGPGEKFYYSNEGMNFLGFIMEEITGVPLQQLGRQFEFQPFGMANTSYIWENKFAENYALGHDKLGNPLLPEKKEQAKGAGSMITTPSDYSKFLVTMMKQKGLKRNLFRDMKSNQIAISSERGFGPKRDSLTNKFSKISLGWGLGIGLFQSPYGKAFFHTGHDDGWQNFFVAYPDKGTAIIIMSNSDNFEANAPKIVDFCIGDKYSPFEWLGYMD